MPPPPARDNSHAMQQRPGTNRGVTAMRFKTLFVAAGLVAICAGPALAGSCPADKSGPDVRPMNTTPAAAVTDNVIGAVDLAKEPSARADNRMLRLRKLVVQPGGVVPWHSHGNRPAII